MAHPDTLNVHAGREDFGVLGVHAPPIDLSTTYPTPDLAIGTASFDALVAGESAAANPIYARLHNPTVARVENAIAQLEGMDACIAFGSGMAALTAVLLDARSRGNHVLAVRPLYGTSDHLLASGMCGLETEFVAADQVALKIRPETALIIIETPANPTLQLIDIAAVADAAGDVPVLVDSSFAPPGIQYPAMQGAAYVLHSATKFLSGHGDVMAGVVSCSEARAKPLRTVRAATGALLHPLAAYLLHRGLATLHLRVQRAQENAQIIADRLAAHPFVKTVHFPSRKSGSQADIYHRQMRGPGALMAFELAGGYEAAAAMLASVRMCTSAVSLGAVDTLIQHPAGLTHRVVCAAAREQHGISPGLVRLSVGIEHVEDIWSDLAQALSAVVSDDTRLRVPALA